MKWGIDVSRYDSITRSGIQQPINWSIAGLDLALIKASESLYVDPSFTMQWKAASCLPRVAYHFLRTNVSPIQQSSVFKRIVLSDFTSRDYVAVDFETQDGSTSTDTCIDVLCTMLEDFEHEGIPSSHILVCTYPSFWNRLGGPKFDFFSSWGLWLMQWPKDNWILSLPVPKIFTADRLSILLSDVQTGKLQPMKLVPWSSPAIWQFTSRADTRAIPGYPGCKTVCDYNAVFMSLPEPGLVNLCPFCGQPYLFRSNNPEG